MAMMYLVRMRILNLAAAQHTRKYGYILGIYLTVSQLTLDLICVMICSTIIQALNTWTVVHFFVARGLWLEWLLAKKGRPHPKFRPVLIVLIYTWYYTAAVRPS